MVGRTLLFGGNFLPKEINATIHSQEIVRRTQGFFFKPGTCLEFYAWLFFGLEVFKKSKP